MKRLLIAVASLFCASVALAAPLQRPAAPPVVPVVENYFGTSVTDNYRYMEQPDDPIFGPWIRAEGRYARDVFASIAERAALQKRLAALVGGFGLANSYQEQGGRSFWLERQPGSDNFDLMTRDAGGTRKLIDLAALRAANGGKPFAINYYAASPDGTKVAVGISEAGSELAVMSVYESATGKRIAGPLERIQFGPPSWAGDGKLLFGNQLAAPKPGATPDERYLNSTAIAWDMQHPPIALFGGGVDSVIKPEPAQFSLVAARAGAPVRVALIINGVQNEIEMWLSDASAPISASIPWRRTVTREDAITEFDIHGNTLYLLSHKNAPTFQILALELGQPLSTARVVVPATAGRLLEGVHAAADGVYVVAREGLYSRLFKLDAAGALQAIELPGKGSISAGSIFSDPDRPGVTLEFDSWTTPPTLLTYQPAAKRFVHQKIGAQSSAFRNDAYVTVDLQAAARDGTQVPFSLIRAVTAKGPQPLLIHAYGSYGLANFPTFSPRTAALLSEGIAFGVCHVRGGGELGEAWRLGGKDANKPNTWRDLIACAEKAVKDGITTSQQLFIAGSSAGGVPMGKAPTERPDLFAGVIDQVPMASALRAEFQANGPLNIPEFGTIANEQGFRNLLAMDGYQAIRDGAAYPPFLITTGLNDPRVDSWQPGKLAARMLAANPRNIVLLRVDEDAGHGIGSTMAQTTALYADMISFINWRLRKPGWIPGGYASGEEK
jgi:prolyl oligopeptidase